MCRQASAKLLQLTLGEARKRQSSRVITHLDEEQLEEFFQSAATTVFPPRLAGLLPPAGEAFSFLWRTGATDE